jgi:hypothetical protein
MVGSKERLNIDGEVVPLPPDLASPFGLVLHELATNAAEYGALSQSSGKVFMNWSISARTQQADSEIRLERARRTTGEGARSRRLRNLDHRARCSRGSGAAGIFARRSAVLHRVSAEGGEPRDGVTCVGFSGFSQSSGAVRTTIRSGEAEFRVKPGVARQEQQMPLYYFVLKAARHTYPDSEGQEFDDDMAARSHPMPLRVNYAQP